MGQFPKQFRLLFNLGLQNMLLWTTKKMAEKFTDILVFLPRRRKIPVDDHPDATSTCYNTFIYPLLSSNHVSNIDK